MSVKIFRKVYARLIATTAEKVTMVMCFQREIATPAAMTRAVHPRSGKYHQSLLRLLPLHLSPHSSLVSQLSSTS